MTFARVIFQRGNEVFSEENSCRLRRYCIDFQRENTRFPEEKLRFSEGKNANSLLRPTTISILFDREDRAFS